MINALHSSQVGGTKNFTLDGQNFGWQAIIDMFDRECQRVRDSNARMIPKLREAHIIRDSWIKLNVTPAKIMQVRIMPTHKDVVQEGFVQQEQVLGELFHYVNQQTPPPDALQVQCTLKYLQACSKIFENGLLSHERVTDVNSNVLKSIKEGYEFFRSWHYSLSHAGKYVCTCYTMLHNLHFVLQMSQCSLKNF